jgi:hypothetical protein
MSSGVPAQVDPHGGTPHQPHSITPRGVLKTAMEGLNGSVTALYPHTHGSILCSSGLQIVL